MSVVFWYTMRAPKIYSVLGENKKSDVTLFAGFNDHSAVVVKSRGFLCHEYANITFVLTINADFPSWIKPSMAFYATCWLILVASLFVTCLLLKQIEWQVDFQWLIVTSLFFVTVKWIQYFVWLERLCCFITSWFTRVMKSIWVDSYRRTWQIENESNRHQMI